MYQLDYDVAMPAINHFLRDILPRTDTMALFMEQQITSVFLKENIKPQNTSGR